MTFTTRLATLLLLPFLFSGRSDATNGRTSRVELRCFDGIFLIGYLRRAPAQILSPLRAEAGIFDFSVATARLNSGDQGTESGIMNNGVYRLRTRDGQSLALKLTDREAFKVVLPYSYPPTVVPFDGEDFSHVRFRDYSIIHKALGEFGVAPRLHAILPHSETQEVGRVLHNKGIELRLTRPTVGILMEAIPEAWNFTKAKDTPSYFAEWGEEEISELIFRIREIETFLNITGVMADDVQFFISRDRYGKPRLVLGDLDECYFMPQGSRHKNDFQDFREVLVDKWQAAAKRSYPRALFEKYSGSPYRRRKDRSYPVAP